MGLRSWAKKQARKAKKKAEAAARRAKETAERKAREAAELAERKAREARKKAEEAKRKAQRAFEDALDKTTDPMERLALKAERAVKEGMSEMDVRKMIRDELRDLRDDIKREVVDEIRKEIAKPLADGIETAGREIEKTATDRIPELVTEALPAALKEMAKDLQKLATGPVGNVIFNIAEKAAPGKTTHAIGFVELEIEVRDKIVELRKWIASPPTSGKDVERMCMDFVGDDVIVVRPARILEMIPTFPKMPADPGIPVQVRDIPEIVDQIESMAKDIL